MYPTLELDRELAETEASVDYASSSCAGSLAKKLQQALRDLKEMDDVVENLQMQLRLSHYSAPLGKSDVCF